MILCTHIISFRNVPFQTLDHNYYVVRASNRTLVPLSHNQLTDQSMRVPVFNCTLPGHVQMFPLKFDCEVQSHFSQMDTHDRARRGGGRAMTLCYREISIV